MLSSAVLKLYSITLLILSCGIPPPRSDILQISEKITPVCQRAISHKFRLLYHEINFVVGDDDVDWGQRRRLEAVVRLHGGPACVLQKLRQDVVQRHLDVRKPEIKQSRQIRFPFEMDVK